MQSCTDVSARSQIKAHVFESMVRRPFRRLIAGLCIGTLPMNLLALSTCPNPGMCFLSQNAKDKWAWEHNCVFQPPSKSRDCSEQWRADKDFLAFQEGELIADGYVPKHKKDIKGKDGVILHKKGDPIGASGVTISTGVDLGQQSNSGTKAVIENYVKLFGNSGNVNINNLLEKLNPYFLKKKANAISTLNEIPLHISPEENQLLSQAFGFYTQQQAKKQFDKKNTAGMRFKQLPKEAQTVIVDFSYQYGLSDTQDIIRETFWKYVYGGQWESLANWLASAPDEYTKRRTEEGEMLASGVKTDALPASGNPCTQNQPSLR